VSEASATALECELPVCPRCGLIGKQPTNASTKNYCVGPTKERHEKVAMEARLFREVLDADD
jgi:hypothetical protein